MTCDPIQAISEETRVITDELLAKLVSQQVALQLTGGELVTMAKILTGGTLCPCPVCRAVATKIQAAICSLDLSPIERDRLARWFFAEWTERSIVGWSGRVRAAAAKFSLDADSLEQLCQRGGA